MLQHGKLPAVVVASSNYQNAEDIRLTDTDAAVEGQTPPKSQAWQGYVDQYGFHSLAGGWFFAGWVSHGPIFGTLPEKVLAHFAAGPVLPSTSSLFFFRDDVPDGIGFLVFVPAENINQQSEFLNLTVELDGMQKRIDPGAEAVFKTESKLVPYLHFILSLGERSLQREQMKVLLDGEPELMARGYAECFGYHSVIGGWLVSGWISTSWLEGQPPDRALISFEDGDIAGEAVAVLYRRPDLPEGSHGVLLFVSGPAGSRGRLTSIGMQAGPLRFNLEPVAAVPQLREPEIIARVRSNISSAKPGFDRDRLFNLMARRPYSGEDTLDVLAPDISIYIDDAIMCGDAGLAVMGWALYRKSDVHDITLRCGTLAIKLDLDSSIRIERHDVLEGFAQHGFDDPKCGFIAFLPGKFSVDERLYLEVETTRLEVAYRNVAKPKRTGITAIKKLLGAVDLRFGEINDAFDRVLGPAVEALNKVRLSARPAVTIVDYGVVPKNPTFSIIIPLYGRLDFVEYQLALFSLHPQCADYEFIYVLDDPPKRREAQLLFTSAFERFQIPFRAVLLERNMGFAPANNIGMQYANGTYIAYLNSDVFPGSLDWLEKLAARLVEDPTIGVIGPLLLFEDNSVQHRGMFFERLPEFGNWYFCMHTDKGLRFAGTGLARFVSITGACMLLRRDLAEKIGGFDEIYAIGDFEDSDLCLKVQKLGLACVVDSDVQLFHLERKSQTSAALNWRMNVTAYNAWQHERRWSKFIEHKQSNEFRSLS